MIIVLDLNNIMVNNSVIIFINNFFKLFIIIINIFRGWNIKEVVYCYTFYITVYRAICHKLFKSALIYLIKMVKKINKKIDKLFDKYILDQVNKKFPVYRILGN